MKIIRRERSNLTKDIGSELERFYSFRQNNLAKPGIWVSFFFHAFVCFTIYWNTLLCQVCPGKWGLHFSLFREEKNAQKISCIWNDHIFESTLNAAGTHSWSLCPTLEKPRKWILGWRLKDKEELLRWAEHDSTWRSFHGEAAASSPGQRWESPGPFSESRDVVLGGKKDAEVWKRKWLT